MAASDMLSQLQFNHFSSDGFHTINATHPDAGFAGRIHWAAPDVDDSWMVDPGEVKNIFVDKKFRGNGLASDLWNRAKAVDPGIKHAVGGQTEAGKGWAAKVGD